jgi:hypothetical protein
VSQTNDDVNEALRNNKEFIFSTRSLTLNHIPLSKPVRRALIQNTTLRSVKIAFEEQLQDWKFIAKLIKNKPIRKLMIRAPNNVRIGLDFKYFCESVKENNRLESLHLYNILQTEEGAQQFCDGLDSNTSIQSLSICSIEADIFAVFANRFMDNSNVKAFRIWAYKIDPESIAKIIKYNRTLSTISFRMTNLASAGESLISALKLNTSLKKIALQGNRTGIVSITQSLKRNFSLRNITFWSLDCKDEQLVKDLIESTKNNKIEKFVVVYSKIGGDLLRELLAVESFKSLKLVSCTSRSNDIRIIGEKLKTNRNLTHLDLSCNTISAQDMPYLVEALKFNKTLTRLNFTECEIQSESAQYFAEIIRTNSTLQDLNLDNNLFDSNALKTIGDAVSTNKTLLRLYIRHEKMGNVLPAFTEALKVNKSLEYLFLVYDPDDFKSVNDFCEVMKNNTTLRELIVRGVQREDLTTEPNQQIVQLFHDIFTTNKALTKFKVQVPIGLHIQQRFNNFTDENERQQIRFKNDTKILMHNIVKSSSARQLLPIEIWRQIFSQLDYPGIKSLKAMTEAICK